MCLFILERASQETAHRIISDLWKLRFTSVSLNVGLPLNKNGRSEIDIYRRGVHRVLCSRNIEDSPFEPRSDLKQTYRFGPMKATKL
jgi:hypothetical protein